LLVEEGRPRAAKGGAGGEGWRLGTHVDEPLGIGLLVRGLETRRGLLKVERHLLHLLVARRSTELRMLVNLRLV